MKNKMTRHRKRQANSKLTVSLPRRSTRNRNEVKHSSRCIQKRLSKILDLPNELLLMIFKLLPHEDLVCNISVVCKRWKDLTRTLWTKIEMKRNMSQEIIYKWISRAPLVRHLVIRQRDDLNEILERVSQNCKELETLAVYNATGSRRSFRVRGKHMCHLITNCPNLSFIHLSGTRFNSCKFFRLLPKPKNLTSSKMSYVGCITYRELCVLLESAKQYETESPTEIGVQTMTGRCRLNLNLMNISRLLEILKQRNKERLISIIWNASKELFNCHFNVENPDLVDLL